MCVLRSLVRLCVVWKRRCARDQMNLECELFWENSRSGVHTEDRVDRLVPPATTTTNSDRRDDVSVDLSRFISSHWPLQRDHSQIQTEQMLISWDDIIVLYIWIRVLFIVTVAEFTLCRFLVRIQLSLNERRLMDEQGKLMIPQTLSLSVTRSHRNIQNRQIPSLSPKPTCKLSRVTTLH